MKKLIIICIIATMFAGCHGGNSVDKAISQVEKSIDKLQKNKGKMTDAEWQNLQKETEEPLKVIADALQNNKVGALDKLKIIALTAKWTTAVMDAGFIEMQKAGFNPDSLGNELQKAADESDQPEQEDSVSESNP